MSGFGDPELNLSLPEGDLSLVVDELRQDWLSLKRERLLITGASGFVGRWMLEAMLCANRELKLGLRCTVVTRKPQVLSDVYSVAIREKSLDVLPGDLRSVRFPSGAYSHVLHLATGAPKVGHWSHGGFFIDDQVCSERVAEFCLKAGVSRLLFTSSGAVYRKSSASATGFVESSESSPDLFDLRAGYGLGKRSSEYVFHCLGQVSGVAPKIARLFSFCGPGLPTNAGYAVGNFIRDALIGNDIVIRGDGTAKRSYLYAADMALWLWRILFSGEKSAIFNVGGSRVVSIAELAGLVARHMSSASKIVIKNELPSAENADYFPDVSRAQIELGLSEFVSLEAAIEKTARWVSQKR